MQVLARGLDVSKKTEKVKYLVLADYMLEQGGDMLTIAELAAGTGFTIGQVDSFIASLRGRDDYKVFVSKSGRHKYSLKKVEPTTGHKRDFVTELFTGRVVAALELARYRDFAA